MVLFCLLPTFAELSVYFLQGWQEKEGLREENKVSELRDQTKTS